MYTLAKNRQIWTWAIGALFLLLGCRETEIGSPKPRQYPRIDFPEKAYRAFTANHCALGFDYPAYAEISQDAHFFDEPTPDSCWFDIHFPAFNGQIHCSYYPIDSRKHLDKLVSDAFVMVSKHNIKASARRESIIQRPDDVSGLLFEIDGPVASPIQFFLTDSVHHFMRGSLYFASAVNPDSMRLVHDFIKEDIEHLISTFYWKNVP